jgi:hypothetical protein
MGRRSILRAPSGGSIDYEEWRDGAACKGVDPDLFEIGEDLQRGEEKQELIAWGLRICSKCPVRKPCGASATESDRYWTTRGGQPPEGLFEDSVAPNSSPVGTKRGPKKSCVNGHESWAVSPLGTRYCVPCRAATDEKSAARKRAKRAEEKAAKLAG